MRLLIAISAIVIGLVGTAQARDIFVDNVAGDDLNQGISPRIGGPSGGPCRTIAKALRMAEKSDRIVLTKNAEPYRESITLQGGKHSGLTTIPFIIEGNGAVLDGRMPIPAEA